MKITTFPTYPDALDALAKELRARRFSPTEYRIVLTPDRYTLQAEKALFGGSGAIDWCAARICRCRARVA